MLPDRHGGHTADQADTPDPIAAAAGAMSCHCDNLGIPVPSPALARALAEVAAPHLATKQANLQAAIDRVQHLAEVAQAKAVELAVAAERERIAQVAEREAARIRSIIATGNITYASALSDFATRLRQEPAPGRAVSHPDAPAAPATGDGKGRPGTDAPGAAGD